MIDGKAKGKILLGKGKVSDAKGALGTYVYETRKNGGALDESRLAELCGEIDKHLEEIERLQAEAKKSGEDISGAFDGFAGARMHRQPRQQKKRRPRSRLKLLKHRRPRQNNRFTVYASRFAARFTVGKREAADGKLENRSE